MDERISDRVTCRSKNKLFISQNTFNHIERIITMKKLTKIMISLMVAVFMVLSFAGSANAAEQYTITVNRSANDKKEHKYEAYQIFKGTLSGTGADVALKSVTWGDGIDGAQALTEVKKITEFSACSTAADVAEVLAENITNQALAEKFADAVNKCLGSASGEATLASGQSSVSISDLAPGYYLIKDKDGSLANVESAAYTDLILQVVGDVNVTAKEDVPSLDKVIEDNGSEVKSNAASIGDKVNYCIKSSVPDMSGYEKYFFVVNDTLSGGLTFNNDVKVYLDGTELSTSEYLIEQGADGKFSVIFKNFISHKNDKGKSIEIKYSATVNENAVVTEAGNPNTAGVIFSNDPNVTPSGDPNNSDKPGPSDITGKTPESTTKTYVTEIKVLKKDADTGDVLEGAKFAISGDSVNIVKVNAEMYEEAADGTYYMLKDGTFSTTVPTTEQGDPNKKYKKVTKVSDISDKTKVNKSIYTDSNGEALFTGLGEGTYSLTELEAPEHYNVLENPVSVSITAKRDATDETKMTFEVSGDGATVSGNTVTITIGNNKGFKLPGTGGIGTVVFYVVGGILVVLALILLVTRKRIGEK